MEAVGKLRNEETSALLAKTDQETMTKVLTQLQDKYKDQIRIDFSFVEDAREHEACNKCPGGKEFMFLDHK